MDPHVKCCKVVASLAKATYWQEPTNKQY